MNKYKFMKICIITSLYKPYSKGGAEQIVENIVNGLITNGHEIILITTGPMQKMHKVYFSILEKDSVRTEHYMGGELSEKELEEGRGDKARVIRFFPWNLFWFGNIDKKPIWLRLPWHIFDVFNLYSYFKIKKILKKEKPDVVMTHNLKGIGYTVPAAIKVCGIKHLHTIHDVQLIEPSGLLYQSDTNKLMHTNYKNIYEWINKKLFGSPDIIISPSQWLLDFYINRGFFKNSKKVIMKNPTSISQSAQDSILLEKRDIKNKNLKLLYIGQIEEHKGILFLVDIIKGLPNVHLDIVGAGKKLEDIKKLIQESDNIKIYGYVKNELLNNFFAQNDFLVVPSLCYENAPTVIYESFANGVPVIASNIGGIPELVKEGYNGYRYWAGNEESLFNSIKKCINEKDKWKNLRENALKSVNGLGIKEYIEKLLNNIKSF